jgi:hypothetical protein
MMGTAGLDPCHLDEPIARSLRHGNPRALEAKTPFVGAIAAVDEKTSIREHETPTGSFRQKAHQEVETHPQIAKTHDIKSHYQLRLRFPQPSTFGIAPPTSTIPWRVVVKRGRSE